MLNIFTYVLILSQMTNIIVKNKNETVIKFRD